MRQIELLKLGENVLKKENIQDSHIKASTLLQYVLKQTKQELIINSKEIVEPSKINKYNNYLQKIIKGTPIQYITKHQQFMALDFYVDENVLIPQPDTEVLVEEGIKIIKEQNMEVLDLCTGSGAIAIEFLSRGAEKAYLCEKNPTAVKMIYNNLEKTKMQDKSVVMLKDYKKALELLKQQNLQFDFVYIDPPYQANISVDSVERILSLNLLKEKGNIIIETDDEKRELLELEKINIEVTDIRKYGRVSLIFLAKSATE